MVAFWAAICRPIPDLNVANGFEIFVATMICYYQYSSKTTVVVERSYFVVSRVAAAADHRHFLFDFIFCLMLQMNSKKLKFHSLNGKSFIQFSHL
jgi:hypothetical protein